MAYAALLEKEGIQSEYLAIIRPRRRITAFTLVSGTKYTASFDYGHISKIVYNGVFRTEATSSALSDGEWHWDDDTSTLTIDVTADVTLTTNFTIATYDLYVGTFDANFYRDPLDSTTDEVYYEPLIATSPQFTTVLGDILLGYLPVNASEMTLINVQNFWTRHIYDSSFKDADVDVYHFLNENPGRDIDPDNVARIFQGQCGNISYQDTTISIRLFERSISLNGTFGTENFIQSYGPGPVDPNFVGKPMRWVFGVADGIQFINVDYNQTITSVDNRTWFTNFFTGDLGVSANVTSGGAHTTTRTYVDSANGLRVGDTFRYDRPSPPDEYGTITSVNKTGSHYIDHTAFSTPATTGTIDRRMISSVVIVKDGVAYYPMPVRDYTISQYNPLNLITFTAGMETTLGMPTYIGPNDIVYGRVYDGEPSNFSLEGNNPTVSDETGTVTNGIWVLWFILKKSLNDLFAELDANDDPVALDAPTFTSLAASVTDEVGFSIPETLGQEMPPVRDIVAQICQSLMLRIFVNNDNKITIRRIGPVGAADKNIEDDEILAGSLSYEFNYDEIISTAITEYAGREVSAKHQTGGPFYRTSQVTSNFPKYVHATTRQKTFRTLFYRETEAAAYSQRMIYYFGDRLGKARLVTKNRFFQTLPDDVIRISRVKMPGFEADPDVTRNRDFSVFGYVKGRNQITIDLDDQKGIEDNSGDW